MRTLRNTLALGTLASGLICAGSILGSSPSAAQTSADFTYTPTSGPVGTVIAIHGNCPASQAGDAIVLNRVSDGAEVDVQVQQGNTANGHVEPWDTTLTVKD